jgi:hypothetical protein
VQLDVALIPIDLEREWMDALRELRCDVFSYPSWGKAAVQLGDNTAILAVARAGTQNLAALPLLVRPIAGGGFDVASPYGYPGLCQRPSIDTPVLAAGLRAMCGKLSELGFVSCFIRGNPLLESMSDLGIGQVMHHGSTVSVNLLKPSESRLADLASGHRYEIRRTAAAGVDVQRTDADEAWAAFRGLYEAAMRRLGASTGYFWSDGHWAQLRSMASAGQASLLMASLADEPLGGAVFLHLRDSGAVHYHLAAASLERRKLQPAKLLLWEAQQHFSQLGHSVLHLGGGLGGHADSLFQFKAGFSPDRHQFFTRRIVLDERAYRALAGNKQTTFFPAYRAV